ncbi:MAG: hypothetical protein Q7S02_06365 [bacterium]|nr:hypothetical protein [bacterium]
MAVFIFDVDALQRMAAVEGPVFGEEWLRDIADGRLNRTCAFPEFKAWYMREVWPDREAFMRDGFGDNPVPLSQALGETMMYGWWGWNRYSLLYSGEIVFLRGFARSVECVQRAQEQGFRID